MQNTNGSMFQGSEDQLRLLTLFVSLTSRSIKRFTESLENMHQEKRPSGYMMEAKSKCKFTYMSVIYL